MLINKQLLYNTICKLSRIIMFVDQRAKRLTEEDFGELLPKRQKQNVGIVSKALIEQYIDEAAKAIFAHPDFLEMFYRYQNLAVSGQYLNTAKVTRFFPRDAQLLHELVVTKTLWLANQQQSAEYRLRPVQQALNMTVRMLANDTLIAALEERTMRADPNYLSNLLKQTQLGGHASQF
jgi:hypothetical protein